MLSGLRETMVLRCAGNGAGRCWCRSARTCRFQRCENCDMPVDKNGKALIADMYAGDFDRNAEPCSYCDGPMPRLW